MPDDTPDEEDDDTTESTEIRWKYIGTVLSAAMLLSLIILVLGLAAGTLTLNPVPQMLLALYGTVVLMAATWAFGRETLDVVRDAKG